MTAKISLKDFLESIKSPVLYWSSPGRPVPSGEALLLEYVEANDYLPGLLSLEGTAERGFWEWEGGNDLRDHHRNSVLTVQVHDEPSVFQEQLEDYLSGY